MAKKNFKAMKTEIDKFDPCREGLDFRKRFKTFEEAWNACERGDWMLWIAAKLEVDIRILTLAKGLCANTVRHLMKDERSIAAVDAAIAFGNGEIDENELKIAVTHAAAAEAAAEAAYAAYTSASYAEAASASAFAASYTFASYAAASAAAEASYAASASAFAASYTSASAFAAAYAAAAEAAYADKKQNQKQTADICREVLTSEVLRLINEL